MQQEGAHRRTGGVCTGALWGTAVCGVEYEPGFYHEFTFWNQIWHGFNVTQTEGADVPLSMSHCFCELAAYTIRGWVCVCVC